MLVALYPGSFDPLTMGHLDIIKRSVAMFDKVVVGVIYNPNKTPFLSLEKRKAMIERVLEIEGLSAQVKVDSFQGLTVNYAQEKNIFVVIRGLRGNSDYEYELTLSLMNKELYPKLETLFLMASPKYSFVSSHLIKEVFLLKGDISSYVHPFILEEMQKKNFSL